MLITLFRTGYRHMQEVFDGGVFTIFQLGNHLEVIITIITTRTEACSNSLYYCST